MSGISFFGPALIGLGPGIVFFLFFIRTKSFVVLLSLFSAFYWLLVLLITSAIFRGFLPIDPTVASYAGVLCATVCIEEAARYCVWRMHSLTMAKLEAISRSSGHAFTALDRLYLALGWGYGHGAVHVMFFFGSILPLTASQGTYYMPACPAMSLFLASALLALGFSAMLAAVMVVSLDGWAAGSVAQAAQAPLLHLATALATLGSLQQGGCLYSVPVVLAIGAASTAYAGTLAWRRGAASAAAAPVQHLRAS